MVGPLLKKKEIPNLENMFYKINNPKICGEIRSDFVDICFMKWVQWLNQIPTTWNPNDPCFDWKRPSFEGFKPKKQRTNVPGSKLPLFPYNRGWSSTQ